MKIKNIVKQYILIILLIAASLYLIFEPGFGFIALVRLYEKKGHYERELIEMRAKIILMQSKVERLKNDSDYLETIIREEMGMVKKGEKILIDDKK